MPSTGLKRCGRVQAVVCLALLLSAGCTTPPKPPAAGPLPPPVPPLPQAEVSTFRPRHEVPALPHELMEVSLPTYRIEPPDVLQIDALRLTPKPPYRIASLDALGIQVTNTLPDAPIAGLIFVEPDGTIALGPTYGSLKVEGMTLEEAKAAIKQFLSLKLKPPYEVSLVLAESRTLQQIRGPHLVRPDGTIGLGVYGSVYVDGLTIEEARAALEEHMRAFVSGPEIAVDVVGFNSKVYYIIAEGAGPGGTQITRFPMTGKTTVLDALTQVNGISTISSRNLIYVVRPSQSTKHKEDEVYHVDWHAIANSGRTETNYQLMPGDRVYVKAAPIIVTDTYVGLFLAPIQQAFAAVGLGNGTVRTFLTPIPTQNNQILTSPGL